VGTVALYRGAVELAERNSWQSEIVSSVEKVRALFRVAEMLNVKIKSLAAFASKSGGQGLRYDLQRRANECFARFRGSDRRRCGRCVYSVGNVLSAINNRRRGGI
jgi:hypothetical protein